LRDALAARYPYVNRASQFLLGSRFPITLITELPRVPYSGRTRTSRAVSYRIETPQGPVALYAVHPISPRGAFGLRRYRSVFTRLRQNEVAISNDEESDMLGNAGLRSVQIEEAARRAGAEQLPVIIAGDTNLPGLSAVLRHAFAGYQDGFAAASWGFGYTFPAKRPFLRLDRIFAGPEFRFTSFQLGCHGVSDHLCVWADLARR
jgi:endonuclease/exonuclease/phosphatase family metal-dependent hydrolase